MTPQDLRILSTALGFTAVVMQGENISKKDGARRATGLANLIEEFCHTALPDSFGAGAATVFRGDTKQTDRLIERFKGNLKDGKTIDLPHDRDLLLQLYDRLYQRHRSHATDNLIADEILHLLDEELLFDAGVMQDADTSEETVAEKLEVQHRMANAIITIIKAKGQCQPHDLKAESFTQHEIAVHWPMAYALAQVELKIED